MTYTDTFVIDTGGNMSVNGVGIIKPTFANDILTWTADDGNLSNGSFPMQDQTSANMPNWHGFADSDDNSSTESGESAPTSPSGSARSTTGDDYVVKAARNMNVAGIQAAVTEDEEEKLQSEAQEDQLRKAAEEKKVHSAEAEAMNVEKDAKGAVEEVGQDAADAGSTWERIPN
ncbi:hypothetical protein FSARC_10438 [Fusarium sarcochroum]|uniref:Uncharacterized protein n=1 Tax=Fusarium sarcochroum TaxID=1208366 RepID=A0A8H4X3H9_9HYPO|nr:hypothetical protein FSARC_10438 [Fusarium sarcochroum]